MRVLFHCGLVLASMTIVFCGEVFGQWTAIQQLHGVHVICLTARSDSELFVGGYPGVLVKSTDEGQNWRSAYGNLPADTILSLAFQGDYLFAGTSWGIYRSSDLGNTWQLSDFALPFTAEFASTDSALYAASQNGVFRTTDFGVHWEPTDHGIPVSTSIGTGVRVLGVASVPGALYVTMDLLKGAYLLRPGTSTWSFIGLEAHWCNPGALGAVDTTIFAGTWDGVFTYSGQDTTWMERDHGLTGSVDFFTNIDSLLFAYAGWGPKGDGGIFVTSNLGRNWTEVSDSILGTASINAILADKTYLFAGTQTGVWRMPIRDVVTSVGGSQAPLAEGFSLSQNYPNPFNPTTTIRYDLPRSVHAELKIYNVLGELVATLVDATQRAGQYDVTFDGARFASGVYFYRLQADDFTRVMKFMLIK